MIDPSLLMMRERSGIRISNYTTAVSEKSISIIKEMGFGHSVAFT